MFKLMTLLIMIMIISFGLMMVCLLISTKSIMDRENLSPFECGFDPFNSPRMPFSIQFFLIAILFLIFDVEIIMIMPMIITLSFSNLKIWFITISMFIMVLILGLCHEWKNGILEWSF
nr:NADH dehydrogenase subunit 3 [Myrmedobia distinguenda]